MDYYTGIDVSLELSSVCVFAWQGNWAKYVVTNVLSAESVEVL